MQHVAQADCKYVNISVISEIITALSSVYICIYLLYEETRVGCLYTINKQIPFREYNF